MPVAVIHAENVDQLEKMVNVTLYHQLGRQARARNPRVLNNCLVTFELISVFPFIDYSEPEPTILFPAVEVGLTITARSGDGRAWEILTPEREIAGNKWDLARMAGQVEWPTDDDSQ